MPAQARHPQHGFMLPEKRGLSRVEAAEYIGFGTTTFDRMVSDGLMPAPKRFGTRKVWDRHALDLAFLALPSDDSGSDGATDSWSDM
ncbi:helix-turn-helix transcriptional regulator [Thioclava sp. GXIMD4215]|uniref:helix-turn-helix transcriptional regulator n=1 Tax=Thioclava sp. GXIMD4215 TaxID=3131928 RepID=UPI003248A59A